ncbi:N-terminal domain of NEFA-interacting nuclear protein NIP30-domain-containing protein [Crucibulum laeve]|uniref:N-terminal domain of NEFA-interacting nuclear protein NIP30-domain-containing protein n=1 Tax=Crucibulum laeve TaxID=68775 RepID=A0A5C3M6G5_9AGAR|nr:N-terminal domain of NEFA-interacting nuclear protein NIP30-domain-containing protein [Crucibulum laeve]
MEESMIPSLSAGAVGSRFVSQNEIETAKARREEQWKAAYARLGQEPPPQQQEDSYDGRSLAEKLAANRIAKQEEWEEKTKLANQFRALEEDEIMFLDSIRERQEEEERQRKERDGEELKGFKEAVAARTITSNPPPVSTGQPSSASAVKPITTSAKKDPKRVLKGVIVKRKAKPVPKTLAAPGKDEKEKSAKAPAEATDSDDQPPDPKRRKTSIS